MHHFLLILTVLITALRAQQPSIEVQLQSSFLLVGEEVALTVTVRNLSVSSWPTSPVVSPLSLRQGQYSNMIINGRVSKSFTYALSGLREGIYEIPPFRIGNISSNILSINILAKDKLEKGSFTINGETHPYYSATLVGNERPYLGQTQPVEAKLYLPRNFRVESLSFADFSKGEFVAWRFDADQNSAGAIRIEGTLFSSFTYRSSITPITEGMQPFGPGKALPVIITQVPRRGGFSWIRHQPEVTFPTITLDVQELPKPSPSRFGGAVGSFSISAKTTGTEVTVGDPVTVEITVTGTGNLDQLSAPKIIDDEENFKSFDATKKPQGQERRSSTGSVEFSQIIRPKTTTPTIPSYELSFFDPISENYRSTLSAPIPITVQSGTAIASVSKPRFDSQFLTPSNFIIPAVAESPARFPSWLWQIIPATLTTFFIARIILRRLQKKNKKTAAQKKFSAELADTLSVRERPELYRRASRLIENWSPSPLDSNLQKIMSTRDEICFSPAAKNDEVLPKERTALKAILSHIAPLILICLIGTPLNSHAEDWRNTVEEKPTPEAFHNLAVIEQEDGNTSAAALYLYRYQAYTGAKESINKLLSKTGGYRLREPSQMEHLAILPYHFYQNAGIATLWSSLLIILVFFSRQKNWLIALIPIAIISGSLWGVGSQYYPSEISYKPLIELSVLMETSELLSAPFKSASQKGEIPATSVAYVHATRGNWVNVEFPGGLRGWVPRQTMAPIQGRSLWNPPSQKD